MLWFARRKLLSNLNIWSYDVRCRNSHCVAVVGAGPAGFYTAQQILKGHQKIKVDIYERLPVPFGLVRFGVAPDHPEVKNVINTFTQTASQDRLQYYGNVTVGKDVMLDELRTAYTAVVLSYGANSDRIFAVPGEDLSGVMSARSFVGWYNGLPQDRDLKPNLSTDTAVIFGHGNVAIDVARILLTPVDLLQKTDITEYALDALTHSRITRVFLVGRRGPLQVAFTPAELREMIRLPGCCPNFYKDDFVQIQQHINDVPRPRKRLTELMVKTALNTPSPEDQSKWSAATKRWYLKFCRSPKRFIGDGQNVVGVELTVNKLEKSADGQYRAVPTEQLEQIDCGLVLRSIGYQSELLEKGAPFDAKQGVVPNKLGRVTGQTGLYCSGWVKRGPVGVLATTMNDAFETGKTIVEDLLEMEKQPLKQFPGSSAILNILQQRGVSVVTFSEWGKIDAEELERGRSKNKSREKVVDVVEMLHIAKH